MPPAASSNRSGPDFGKQRHHLVNLRGVKNAFRPLRVQIRERRLVKQTGIRSDNWPEFIAYAIQDWMEKAFIKTIYITPGSPWENGHMESFHDKLRDECLNRELFGTLAEARVILESWRVEYNDLRPHSSLGYMSPTEYMRQSQSDGGLRAPQTPRRSPRQAFRGNWVLTHLGGKETKQRNKPQRFSFEGRAIFIL